MHTGNLSGVLRLRLPGWMMVIMACKFDCIQIFQSAGSCSSSLCPLTLVSRTYDPKIN